MRKCGFLKIETVLIFSIFLMIDVFSWGQGKKYLNKSFRLTIDNDFLNYRGTGTDHYYTNGVELEFSRFHEKQFFFAGKLLLNTGNDTENIAHWSITQLMFTPDHIRESQVLCNDRSYAGSLYITRGRTSFSSSLNLTLHSEINIGVIGPYSFAKNTQTWMHRIISNPEPQGWNNQIKTDIVLNYNIKVSKQIFNSDKLQGNVQVASRAGTLFNDLNVGFGLSAGKLDAYPHDAQDNCILMKMNKSIKSEIYFFSNGQLKLVLGNSLLQGGFIQSFKNACSDFYHIDEENINRLVSLLESGIVINKFKWSLSLSENFISKEFKTTKTQLFGRIRITRRFS